jgi:L-lysine 2,3-aminomutase
MIARRMQLKQHSAWQIAIRDAVTDPAELLSLLKLDSDLLPAARQAAARFRLRVPRGFIALMQTGDPEDPLLRQVLPLAAECINHSDFISDPVGDLTAMKEPGLLQKYQRRVLLIATPACAIHCRYCFRREFPYGEAVVGERQLETVLSRIEADETIEEVILSGGDPLSLSDTRLAQLARGLSGISHVRRLRIHTRMPVVIPERVDSQLLAWLSETRPDRIMVLHVNHHKEIGGGLKRAANALRGIGVTLLNQSVLLRGVNDSVEILKRLSEELMSAGILPYYLHALDRVRGAAHFEVAANCGISLIDQLRRVLPGYLVPRFVREVAGSAYKLPLA